MATKRTAPKPVTPERAHAPLTPERAARPVTPEAARDAVAAVSRRADGTPDQGPGFVVLGETRDG